jgi:hypothetical protein
MKIAQVISNLEALAEMLPKPNSVCSLHLDTGQTIAHNNPEIEALHEAIRYLEKFDDEGYHDKHEE